MPNDPEPLLSVEAVSEWLGVPRGTLLNWRYRGDGPRSIKVGGSVRYRRADVEAYLDQQASTPAPAA